MNVPLTKSPKQARSPVQPPQLPTVNNRELESVESEINSARRDSLASQGHQLNPTLTDIGPEIIIVKQSGKKSPSPRSKETSEKSQK